MKEAELCWKKRMVVKLRLTDECFEGSFGDHLYSIEVDYQNLFGLDQDDWEYAAADRINMYEEVEA